MGVQYRFCCISYQSSRKIRSPYENKCFTVIDMQEKHFFFFFLRTPEYIFFGKRDIRPPPKKRCVCVTGQLPIVVGEKTHVTCFLRRWLAAFSLFAIASVVCLVVIGSPFYAEAERLAAGGETALDAPLLWWNWTGAFSKLGSMVFALTCAPAALHAYSAMEERTDR